MQLYGDKVPSHSQFTWDFFFYLSKLINLHACHWTFLVNSYLSFFHFYVYFYATCESVRESFTEILISCSKVFIAQWIAGMIISLSDFIKINSVNCVKVKMGRFFLLRKKWNWHVEMLMNFGAEFRFWWIFRDFLLKF